MSFYTPDIGHPQVENEAGRSGTVTAGASWAKLTTESLPCTNGVWVKNNDSTNDCNVRAIGSANPNGILLSAGEDRFFPVFNVNELEVSRAGANSVTVSWWLQ